MTRLSLVSSTLSSRSGQVSETGSLRGVATDAEVYAELDLWKKQAAEWDAICKEMIERGRRVVTPHQVTTEQRKRMLARGERPADVQWLLSFDAHGRSVVRSRP